MQHWHILGAGAIGGLFATLLQDAGIPCTLLLRDDDPDLAAGSACITLRRDDQLHKHRFAVSANSEDSPLSYLLVCTKAYDMVPAIAGIEHRLAPGATILLLANGLGYQEQVQARWPRLDCFAGSTTEGAFREARRSICHAGHGSTLVGQPGRPSAPDWFASWQGLQTSCEWSADIDTVLWRKLAINCAINPVTALHRCPNGALAEQPQLAALVRELCTEISAIAIASGQAGAVEDLHPQVMAVIRATASNRSSMLQDVLAGRETEIDYLTGYLLAQGQQFGVEAPRNALLLQALKAQNAGHAPA
ncbi:MAG: 2-dehydropantoate 2-reductase [Haliea sp.]|uniref:2-dehydropantoate 2-reductase n=1 Tax=Haliea sp. TaxID=1932666 RepID=UPI0032F064EA